MTPQFDDRAIVEGFDGRFLNRSHHPLGLSVGPGMVGFGQPVLDAVFPTDPFEHMVEEAAILAALRLDELDAIVAEQRVDSIVCGPDQGLQEAGCGQLGGAAVDAG